MEKSLPVPSHIRRLGAYAIDVLICWVLASLIPDLVEAILGVHMMMLSSYAAWMAPAYYLFKDSLPNGQSIGKRALGLSVIGAVTYQDCTWWQSALRNLVLVFLLPLEAVLALLNKRRLGDALASTVVIDARLSQPKIDN